MAQIREILISESTWEEMTCLFAPSLAFFDIIGAIALWTFIKVKDEEPQVQLATH
ncbi:hypothetical protein LAC73_22740 [Escherichia coli]|nr:hypothetical protein [Escherichia coli]